MTDSLEYCMKYGYMYMQLSSLLYDNTVDSLRTGAHRILESHYKAYQEEGRVGRVEFLPVRWHGALHGDATGVDRCVPIWYCVLVYQWYR